MISCHSAPDARMPAMLACHRARSRARKGAVPYGAPDFQKPGEIEYAPAPGAAAKSCLSLEGPYWCQPSIDAYPGHDA